LCQDPAESLDLAARSPEIVSRLESCFHAQHRFFDIPAASLSPLRALADDLRSLGYL
jgi:hypothetical protein